MDRAACVATALEPVVTDLLAAGVRLNAHRSMHLLYAEDYPVGLPILLAHLAEPYDDVPRAVLAGALFYTKNPHTRAIWPEVADLYSGTPNTAKPFRDARASIRSSAAKQALANALLKLYEPSRMPLLLDLIKDKGNGETRVLLLAPLLRVKARREDVRQILVSLKTDPVLATELAAKGI